jgi:threonine/homoserine/homoserine lactone efflux protein
MNAITLEFLTTALLMELTPGPNMTWLALLSMRQGRGAGVLAVAGIALGLALLAIVAAAGLAPILTTYPLVYEALRWAGVLFLLYLAIEAWRGEKSATAQDDSNGTKQFQRGLLINLLNPKAASVFVVLIPGFIANGAARLTPTLIFSAIYVAIATAVHLSIVAFAGSFQKTLANPRFEVLVRRTFAILLAGVAIWLAATTKR